MKKLLITLTFLLGVTAVAVEARRCPKKCPKKCPKYCPKKMSCPKETRCRDVEFEVKTVEFGTEERCIYEPTKVKKCETVPITVYRRICHEVPGPDVMRKHCVRVLKPGTKTIKIPVKDEMCPEESCPDGTCPIKD